MDRNQRPQQRELVYCHDCENEWYRDEHGLVCPNCRSDFAEVIEPNNDFREDEMRIPGEPAMRNAGAPGAVPDPDEDDIDALRWEQTGPGTYRVRGRYNMDVPLDRNGQPAGQQGGGGGLMGMVGNLLQGMVSPQQGQDTQPYQRSPSQRPGEGGNARNVRHGHGPGFSYTIATSSNADFGGNLFPRNANGPQPFQPQPNQLDNMLAQMFMNVGAMPGGPMRGGPGAGQHPLHGHDPFGPGPNQGFMFGGPGGFANILNMLGHPDQQGDAVYTQEALDRIMTQLMEQHHSGNAPGPATEQAIKSLPRRAVTAEVQGTEGKAECSICMDEVPLGDMVTELPCHHWFHHDCVKAWLAEHDTCPHCRQGIMPKEGEGSASRTPGQQPLNDMRSPEQTRTTPGAFPQGDGSRGNPFTMPESPRGGGQGSAAGGMFNRMREAFGGGGSGGSGSQGGNGNEQGGRR